MCHCRNYEYHHRYSDAADLMVTLATAPSTSPTDAAADGNAAANNSTFNLDIARRIEYFTYAVNSGRSAVNNPHNDASSISTVLSMENLLNIEDQLTVASKCSPSLPPPSACYCQTIVLNLLLMFM